MTSQRSMFSWALDLCLVTGESALVDLIPEDGFLRSLSPEDEETLGQSVERMVFYKLRRSGSLTRLKCDERTSPEILYIFVARSLRIASLAQLTRQQQQQQHRNAKAAAAAAAAIAAAASSSSATAATPANGGSTSSTLPSSASGLTLQHNSSSGSTASSVSNTRTNNNLGLENEPLGSSATPILAASTTATSSVAGGVNVLPPNTPPPLISISTPIIGISSSAATSNTPTGATNSGNAVGSTTSSSHHHHHHHHPSSSSSTNKWFHVMIIQDLDKAPVRTALALGEMLATRRLSAPPPSPTAPSLVSSTLGMPESMEIPHGFVTLATSMRLPVPTPFYTVDSAVSTTSSSRTTAAPPLIPHRLLQSFLLRVPILLPKSNTAAASSTPVNAHLPTTSTHLNNITGLLDHDLPAIYISPLISKYVRDLITAVTANPAVKCGPGPRALDVLLLAVRANAALRKSRFAVPQDLTSFLIELLAHRIIMRSSGDSPEDDALGNTYNHPVVAARNVVAHAINCLNRMEGLR